MEHSLLLRSHSDEKARELLAERYSLSGSQKPFLVLHEGVNDTSPGVTKKKRKHNRKSVTSAALEKFRKYGDPKFEIYKPLNELWTSYIATVLTGNGAFNCQALLAADWHGAPISVFKSRNPSFVGLEGLLLWEGSTQWLMVTTDNKFRLVPKRGTVVRLHEYTVIGDRVLCRSTERTTKKFKPHDVGSIAPLLALLFE